MRRTRVGLPMCECVGKLDGSVGADKLKVGPVSTFLDGELDMIKILESTKCRLPTMRAG
mgnify:CR=1 FL=1